MLLYINMTNSKTRKKQKNKKLNCSGNKKSYTCYSANSLNHMKKRWNSRHPDSKILTEKPKEIWSSFKKYLRDSCETEACWMRQNFMKDGLTKELLNYTFAPFAPSSWVKNPNTWLTSVDISKVMKQYENRYPKFNFIGPSPIDYDALDENNERVWDELYDFDVDKQIKKGKYKIGIVFNTDDHTKSGAHWISLFINLKTGEMDYFDSVGDKAPSNVKKFCNMVKKQAKKSNHELPEFVFDEIYPNSHQKKDTECGIYSLYFIKNMIEKNNFDFFKHKKIKDDDMEKFRDYFFN
mgnify:CR=1 FL=1|tara:strand:+ start:7635 stop:8516 length:882 start_codon:yes stop_codon:yes gene_type:complete